MGSISQHERSASNEAISLERAVEIATQIRESRYPGAGAVLLAGSIVRNEGTAYSDLDLIVLFDELPHAYVETFYHDGVPIEAYVQDPETLHFFMSESDRASGACVVSQMVSEGIELPAATELSRKMKNIAAAVIAAGPAAVGEGVLSRMRYGITNLVDDIRQPRSKEEAVATGTLLYGELANCYFRANRLWSAKGKAIPKKLQVANPALGARFCNCFERLFVEGHVEDVITLAEEILEPVGGFLFDGNRLDAPAANRKALTEADC